MTASRRHRPVKLPLLAALCLAASFGPAPPARGAPLRPISFGVLPVIQALPLFVAQEQGYFAREGLEVELVLFNSGLEKDVALATGRISGYFGDMITSLLVAANQVPSRMVAVTANSTGDQRYFAVLSPPGRTAPSLEEAAARGIAGSSNTIIHYIVEHVLGEKGPARLVETRSIPLRLQMLLEGQVAGAALPEPLVTLAERKGATVIADDRGLGISPTVLTFRQDYLEGHREDVKGFLRACARAAEHINSDPESVRPVMIRHARIPEPLQAGFPIPGFQPPAAPDPALVGDVLGWLQGKGAVKAGQPAHRFVQEDLVP